MARAMRGSARLASFVLVLAALWALWEGYRWLWIREGRTWPFAVSDITMPHMHLIVRQLFESPTVGGPLLITILWHSALFTAKEAVVGFAIGATIGFLLGVALSHFRVLQRGLLPYIVASQTIPILAIAPMVVVGLGKPHDSRLDAARLGARLGDRGVPHLLPGHDQHAARAPIRRPTCARADALLRGERLVDSVEAACSVVAAGRHLVKGDWIKSKSHQATAVKFLQASFKGWIYCRDHWRDCVNIVVKAGTALPKGHQTWQMNEVNALIWPNRMEIGIMDPVQYKQTANIAYKFKVIKKPAKASSYRPDLAKKAVANLKRQGIDVYGRGWKKKVVKLTEGGK